MKIMDFYCARPFNIDGRIGDKNHIFIHTCIYAFTHELINTSYRHKETDEMFSSFDDYLGEFKSKRRIQIKRERRKGTYIHTYIYTCIFV